MDPNKWLLTEPNNLISLDKWQRTVNLLAKLFKAPAGFLVQHTERGYQVTLSSEQESNPYSAGVIIEPDVNIFCRRIVETRQELYVSNAPLDPCWDTNPEVHNDGFRSYLGVPVFWPDGTAFGTFCVMDYQETHYDDTYFELIRQLKEIIEADLSLSQVYEEIREMAMTDPLTGLYNRRGFNMLAEQRVQLARRMQSRLGLLYFDIDQFKLVNDTQGHAVGDQVLKQVADAMQQSLRNSDVLARLGGDEFVAVVLLEQDSDVEHICGRFRQAMTRLKTLHQQEIQVSCGFTLLDIDCCDIDAALNRADEDMYRNKRAAAAG